MSLFSSCILLSMTEFDIGSNDYSDLKPEELKRIQPTAGLSLQSNFNYSPNLYEIDSSDIQTIINSHEIVWLHIWRPFCSAEECQFIAPFQAKAKQHNLKLFMISETYDFKSLDTIAHRANYAYPFFVIKGSTFGDKIDKSRKKFISALAKNQTLQPTKYADDFLYKNGTLIFADDHLIDSLNIVLERIQ